MIKIENPYPILSKTDLDKTKYEVFEHDGVYYIVPKRKPVKIVEPVIIEPVKEISLTIDGGTKYFVWSIT